MNNSDEAEVLHVIYDYTSQSVDELTLKRGSLLKVLSKDEKISGSPGWWAGRLIDSDLVGIFPADFVASSEPNLKLIDFKDLQIGDVIGIGGFGQVHYGKFGDVDVAIKTAKSLASFSALSPRTSSADQVDAVHKNLIEGLLREARLFANLNHRNIIHLFGVSPMVATKNLFLVMEYARGGALSELLRKRKAGLYPNVFIQYAKQIADGMNYLHIDASEHIIHRDLKCSNILISESIRDVHDDNELLQKTLKITDFGLAKNQLQSYSGTTAGTFPWMSPESIRNNAFSTKSDVWSFGVLLWECLTGEIPYQGFDQVQLSYGIATNKYSLPIPSTCPQEFSQLMKECWHFAPQDRLTFAELLVQIENIIQMSYAVNRPNSMQPDEGAYSSLQQDWRREIRQMFEELKTKEQEIRDREQAMMQRLSEQNEKRAKLEKWEQELRDREMHLVERELALLMAPAQKDRHQPRSPKVHKRSGHFMRSLLHATLNGSSSLSSATATNMISSPTNFRHLISVCRDADGHHRHHHEQSSIDSETSSGLLSPTSPSATSSKSTPTTPNLSRLRTLTSSGDLTMNRFDCGEFLVNNDAHLPLSSHDSPPEKQHRVTSATLPRSPCRKSKIGSTSTIGTLKRNRGKNTMRPGHATWYLKPTSSTPTTNDNATNSSPSTNESDPRTENADNLSSSSSSVCSTPNERSLAHAFMNINSLLLCFGLGRGLPESSLSSIPLLNSTAKNATHQPMLRSTSETNPPQTGSLSSSTNTTPSPHIKKQHKRTCSSPITNTMTKTTSITNIGYRERSVDSPHRPSSLVLSSTPPSASICHISRSDSQLDENLGRQKKRYATLINTPEEEVEPTIEDDREKFYSVHSSKHSTPMVPPIVHISNSQPQLHCPSILDIDTDEQRLHQTEVLPLEVNQSNIDISDCVFDQDSPL